MFYVYFLSEKKSIIVIIIINTGKGLVQHSKIQRKFYLIKIIVVLWIIIVGFLYDRFS